MPLWAVSSALAARVVAEYMPRLYGAAPTVKGDLATRGLLLAMCILEKLQLLPPTDPAPCTLHRMHVEGIRRITAPNTSPRTFAETSDLDILGRYRDHWSGTQLFFPSTCAIFFCMRSSDSESVTWRCIGKGGWLVFFDEKVNKEWVAYPLSPFLEGRRKYVYACKHPGTSNDILVMPGGRNALREALKASFQRRSRPTLMWHPWGRLGAAAFVRLGASIANLMAWARWRSKR